MNDIEQKTLALLNEVELERGAVPYSKLNRNSASEAIYRAIERHEATKQELSDFRQEVSDVAGRDLMRVINCLCGRIHSVRFNTLEQFIIPAPKPDLLVEVMKEAKWSDRDIYNAEPSLRAALDALGFEIREKNDD